MPGGMRKDTSSGLTRGIMLHQTSGLQPPARAGILDNPPHHQSVPDEQDHHRTHHGRDKTCALIGPVPANHLADEGRKESADDAKDRREDKTLRIVWPGREKARNETGEKPDHNDPKDVHGFLHRPRPSMPQRDGGSITR